MKESPILRVLNLTKAFGGVRAIESVSFEIEPRSAVGIIGPNGSGKTTLANLITGFVKPDTGKIFFQKVDISSFLPHKIAHLGIARTFQIVKPFYKMPAFKSLIVPLYSSRIRKMRGGKYGDRDQVAVDLLENVGFEHESFVPYKLAGSLPHGYLKRLDLARCLALRPDLIILDELFSGMSMSEVASTLPILENIREEGTTLIIIEHRLRELFRVVDNVIALNFGRKIAEGPPIKVMDNEEVKKAYLGSEVE